MSIANKMSFFTKSSGIFCYVLPQSHYPSFTAVSFRQVKATPHKARLTSLHVICLHIFRHITQIFLVIRQYCCVKFMQSDEISDCASDAQSLCGVALRIIQKNNCLSTYFLSNHRIFKLHFTNKNQWSRIYKQCVAAPGPRDRSQVR